MKPYLTYCLGELWRSQPLFAEGLEKEGLGPVWLWDHRRASPDGFLPASPEAPSNLSIQDTSEREVVGFLPNYFWVPNYCSSYVAAFSHVTIPSVPQVTNQKVSLQNRNNEDFQKKGKLLFSKLTIGCEAKQSCISWDILNSNQQSKEPVFLLGVKSDKTVSKVWLLCQETLLKFLAHSKPSTWL